MRSPLLTRPFWFAAVAAAVFATGVSAKDATFNFLKAGHPDASEILPAPPALDSSEQAGDMNEVKFVYHAASDSDKAAANSERKFTVFNFTEAVGPWFVETNLPKTAAFFKKVQTD